MSSLIFRKGLDLKHAVSGMLSDNYHSTLVDRIKAEDFTYRDGRLTIHLAREFGFCYGVDRAVDYAYQTRKRFPDKQVFLTGEIDDTVANLIVAQLLHLESEEPAKDINLYINSPGGEMNALFAIYDTMQFIGADVATTCMGQAASSAAVLLAAGAPGKRSTLPHSRVLIHQPWGGVQGQSVDIEIAAREVMAQRRQMIEALARHSGQSRLSDNGQLVTKVAVQSLKVVRQDHCRTTFGVRGDIAIVDVHHVRRFDGGMG